VILANPDLIGKLGVAVPFRFPAGHLLSALSAAVFASFRKEAAESLKIAFAAGVHLMIPIQRAVQRAVGRFGQLPINRSRISSSSPE
jgi:hypothetical protein